MTEPPGSGRFELKFLGSETLYHEVASWLARHPLQFGQPYPERRVNSLYFDTHDYAAYRASIDGISQRTKVRYRWYGDSPLLGPGQLEVKLRHSRTGNKIVYAVPDNLSETEVRWHQIIKRIRDHLPAEGRPWLDQFPVPILINRYERTYWATRDNSVRVTLDRNHTAYDQRYAPYPNVKRIANFPRGLVIEMKVDPEHRLLAQSFLETLPLRATRHSKYCTALGALRGT